MKVRAFFVTFVLSFSALLFQAVPSAVAQAPFEPSQMPERTSFYLIWRGAPSSEVRKTNSLFALWDDPEFAPARTALAENLISSSEKDSEKQALASKELEDFSSLLENPFVLGYVSPPEAHQDSNAAPPAKEPAWNGVFFVYDRTGKEELLTRTVIRLRAQEKDPPQRSQLSIGGVPALKVERKTGVTYWVESGKYAVSANERSVLAEILGRLGNKNAPASSLVQSAAYREAQPFLGGGMLEFFARLPRLRELTANVNPGGFQIAPLLEAIRVDSIHSLCGRLTLEGPRTRMQAALLGDTATGTIFDVWPDGQTTPASFALVPPDAISFNETQVNLLGIYTIVKRALHSAFPQAQQGNADLVDTMAQARLGMSLPDALASLSGELAFFQSSPSLDPAKQVFFLGIRKKPEALKLIRTVLSEQIESESSVGETTFLRISLQSKSTAAGTAGWKFYHLAMTPNFLLGASRKETLREFLEQHSLAAPAATAGALAPCLANRSQFPEKLNGMSCFEFRKLDWQALRDRWITLAQTPTLDLKPAGLQKSTVKNSDWLSRVNPQVFSNRLHSSSSASWKDAKGVHFDLWIE